jgi:hypothetical protein
LKVLLALLLLALPVRPVRLALLLLALPVLMSLRHLVPPPLGLLAPLGN